MKALSKEQEITDAAKKKFTISLQISFPERLFRLGLVPIPAGDGSGAQMVRTYGASNTEKQPTGRAPEGCDENGTAAA
jgi:hypothetical protein